MWTFYAKVLILMSINLLINGKELPKIDLKNKNSEKLLVRDEASQIGAFVVTNLGPKYQESLQSFWENAPACLEKYGDLPRIEMLDGSIRTTFASEKSGQGPDCLENEVKVISEAFNLVDKTVVNIIEGKIFINQLFFS